MALPARPDPARAALVHAHPWIVANDKLRAEGWAPTVTNEQAYVEGTEAKWWTMVTPKRRQEIALGAMIGAIACRRDRRRAHGAMVVATAPSRASVDGVGSLTSITLDSDASSINVDRRR